MSDSVIPESKHAPKYIYILLSLHILFLLLTVTLANRITQIGPLIEPGGIFVFSLTFVICDITCEVYGYKYSRLFIWLGVACELLFALIVVAVVHLPHPPSFTHSEEYKVVLSPTLRFVLSSLTGTLVGEFLNVFSLAKMKLFMSGRFFIIRSIISTAIGQLFVSIIVDILAFLHTMPFEELSWMILSGYLWKMMYAILFVFPSWIIVKYLKKVEEVEYFDINTNFNPLKFLDV